MKKTIWTVLIFMATVCSYGQKTIDAIFSEYGSRNGYTAINIDGSLLKLATLIDRQDEDLKKISSFVTSIRIVASDDTRSSDPQFYQKTLSLLNRSDYEELMDITTTGTKAKILIKAEGNIFSEFVMIVGGDDNALIQIKGKMTTEDVRKLSSDFKSGDDSIFRYR
jgi:hypothetical protein